LVVFLIGKLGIEKLGAKVASVVGADAMPNVIFIATLAYEVNLCIALGSGFGIWPFLELILFDLVENTYCLVCLSRSSAEVGAQGKELFIAATLVVREMVEVTVSFTFLLHVLLVWRLSPQMNVVLCSLTDNDFKQMVLYVLIDASTKVVVCLITGKVLTRRGYKPFALLRGLAHEYKRVFFTASITVWAYFWFLYHTTAGADLTLQFRWLKTPESRWVCGLTWSSP